jgi:hypothetical protein
MTNRASWRVRKSAERALSHARFGERLRAWSDWSSDVGVEAASLGLVFRHKRLPGYRLGRESRRWKREWIGGSDVSVDGEGDGGGNSLRLARQLQ